MSMKALKYALKHALRDEFEEGTVIRWTMVFENSDKRYRYAAIKTPVGWCTTAQPVQTEVKYDAGYLGYDRIARLDTSQITTTTRTYSGQVPPKMTFEALVKVLASQNAQDVAVAATWDTL